MDGNETIYGFVRARSLRVSNVTVRVRIKKGEFRTAKVLAFREDKKYVKLYKTKGLGPLFWQSPSHFSFL